MKIFEMNEIDWVAAPSAVEALAWYVEEFEALNDQPRELDDTELDVLQLSEIDDEGNITLRRSFRQALEANIAEGIKFPCIFASTEA